MKTKVVTFAKFHTYGGQVYAPGDKLDLPENRAAMLEKAGVLEAKAKKVSKDD